MAVMTSGHIRVKFLPEMAGCKMTKRNRINMFVATPLCISFVDTAALHGGQVS